MSKAAPLTASVSRAMFWNSALFPVKMLLGFASSIILVRALEQSQFAAYTAVIAVLNTLGLFIDPGIERTISKFFPEIETRYGRGGVIRFFWVICLLKLALLLLLIIALILFSGFFISFFHFGAEGQIYIVAICINLVLGALSDVFLQFLYSYFKQKATSVLSVAYAALQPILVIAVVLAGWGVPGLLAALIVNTAVNVALLLIPVLQTVRELSPTATNPTPKGEWRGIAERFTRLSALNYFFSISMYFYDMPFVVTVLTNLNDMTGVALFGVAYNRLVNPILQILYAPLIGVQQPLYSRIYVEKNARKLQEAYASFTRFLILLFVPCGVGLALLARNLIRIPFQARYEPAAGIAVLVTAILFIDAILGPGQAILLTHERIREVIVSRVAALASIPLVLFLAPTYGVMGAGVGMAAGRIGSQLLATLLAQHTFALRFPFAFLFRVASASLTMGVVMLFPLNLLERPSTQIDTVVQTLLAFLVGSAVFAVTFKLLGGLEPADKERMGSLRFPFQSLLLRWL